MKDGGVLAKPASESLPVPAESPDSPGEKQIERELADAKAVMVNSESITFEPGAESLDNYVDRLEKEAIVKALTNTSGNKTKAAKLLGITFRALRYKLEKLEID